VSALLAHASAGLKVDRPEVELGATSIEDARRDLGKADEARHDAAAHLDAALEEIEGLLEETDERPAGSARNEAVPAVDPLTVRRAEVRRWNSELGKAREALAKLEPGGNWDLRKIQGDIAALPEQIDEAIATQQSADGDTLTDIPVLIVWALEAGAHPADLLTYGASAAVRELVRSTALLHIPTASTGRGVAAPRACSGSSVLVGPEKPNAVTDTGALPASDPSSQQPLNKAAGRGAGAVHTGDPKPVSPGPVSQADTGALGAAAPSLDRFVQTLRPYQEQLVADASEFYQQVRALPPTAPEAQRRRLYSMPTGTGKGTAQLALLTEFRCGAVNAWIFTPSLEVLRGYLERCGAGDLSDASEDKLAELGEGIFCTTPTRARNRILAGERGAPDVILYDEVHHATEGNDVSGTLFALAPLACWLGFTATPYRGSPRGTLELERAWPDQVEVLNIPEAVQLGAWALPTFEVVALVDDDQVKVAGGDFQSKAAGALVGSRIEDLALLVGQRLDADTDAWQDAHPGTPANGRPNVWVPTAVTVPNTETAGLLVEALDRRGLLAYRVGQDTNAKERHRAYAECRDGVAVLVSVKVLAEGVDLPWLRRLIDARPTLSPVAWLQQVGRITRPGPIRPQYIAVCRNLERHAYLLQGLVPRTVIAKAQEAFGEPSKRGAGRAIGLEALTKFKQISLPLADGVRGSMFALYSSDRETGIITEWAVLLDPTSERHVSACRKVDAKQTDPKQRYGKWSLAAIPEGLEGFATSGFRGKVSEKQSTWWSRAAARHGLDRNAVGSLTQRQFAALPVLSDLGLTMHAQVAG